MKRFKIWCLASVGRLEISDQDLTNWLKEKNLPMLNYVLLKGDSNQVMRVLRLSAEEGFHLRLRLLQILARRSDQEISSAAVLCLQANRPFYYNLDWPL